MSARSRDLGTLSAREVTGGALAGYRARMGAADPYLQKPWLRFYPKGVPATVEVPRTSVSQVFDEATDRWADRAAVAFYGREITYRELREGADRLAAAFADMGVRKGDRLALYLLNSPQFIIAYFAALKCGATVTPISPVYTSHEVRYQLEDSGARAIVCQDILHDKAMKSGAARTVAGVIFPGLVEGQEVILAFLPFFHIYGQVSIMLSSLAQGHLLVLFTHPDTSAILTAMERYRATAFFGVPTLYEYLKDHKDTDKVDWRRLKLVVSGADTLHESTMQGWARRTGSHITEGYGLS